jgi:hypothetical protein
MMLEIMIILNAITMFIDLFSFITFFFIPKLNKILISLSELNKIPIVMV